VCAHTYNDRRWHSALPLGISWTYPQLWGSSHKFNTQALLSVNLPCCWKPTCMTFQFSMLTSLLPKTA